MAVLIPLPPLIFSILVIGAGIGMIFWHQKQRHMHLSQNGLSEKDREYYQTQFRRRVQVAGLLIFIGLLIPALFLSASYLKNPTIATFCLLLMLLFVAWICILAIGDYLSTVLFHQRQLAELQHHSGLADQPLAEQPNSDPTPPAEDPSDPPEEK